MRKTKIVATLGPATESREILALLLKSGADVCRLNLSHGDSAWHEKMVKLVRRVSSEEGTPASIILDLQGPRIRTGLLKDGAPMKLRSGDAVTITAKDDYGADGRITTEYESLRKDVRKGDRILLDDGMMELKVTGFSGDDVRCRVITGGMLKEHKGMNLPGVDLSAPSLTEKDKEDLCSGLKWGIDFIAISFVRNGKDIRVVREFVKKQGHSVPIIAKIERPQAVLNLDDILREADGVMVARGDLGVEMELQRVPLIQKEIIRKANVKGKLVITATQMLESMITNPRPTRAEASDVANAILDGTDAVMLSGETSAGKYPVESVRVMAKIACEAETGLEIAQRLEHKGGSFSAAMAHAALDAAMEVNSDTIIVYTTYGKIALFLSKLKPKCRILALTPDMAVYHRLPLIWGVMPVLIEPGRSTDEILEIGEKTLIKKRLLKKGELVVIVSGASSATGAANFMKLHKVGE